MQASDRNSSSPRSLGHLLVSIRPVRGKAGGGGARLGGGQGQQANKEPPLSHNTIKVRFILPTELSQRVFGVYNRLATDTVLPICLPGNTRDPNKHIHSQTQQICPKHKNTNNYHNKSSEWIQCWVWGKRWVVKRRKTRRGSAVAGSFKCLHEHW